MYGSSRETGSQSTNRLVGSRCREREPELPPFAAVLPCETKIPGSRDSCKWSAQELTGTWKIQNENTLAGGGM